MHVRPWSRGLFEAELDRDDRRYLTAWSGGVLRRVFLGYGGIVLAPDGAHITTLAVVPAARRRGVGRALVGELLLAATAQGATAATLEVRRSNTAAEALYEGLGFASVGVRPGYYPPTRPGEDPEDAVIMWAHDLAVAILRAADPATGDERTPA